jgi:single-stranded-DNA-specific exonuclease
VNRALVAQGLKVMARRERPGIAALLELSQLRDAPSTHTLGFVLGPRINASGRIDVAGLGLRLLAEEDPIEARALAERLDATNKRRQEVEQGVLSAAYAEAEAQAEAGLPVLLLAGETWHPGVVGIVAGRVKERFNRPACVAGIEGGIAKGSGRSVPGVDLGAAIIAARLSGLLLTGGGHPLAAGFSFGIERRAALHDFLNERCAAAAALPGAADIAVEGVLAPAAAGAELAREVARLAPFGAGNEEPVFALARARVVKADRVGREGATIRAFLEGEDGARVKALAFRAKDGALAEALLNSGGVPLHWCGALRFEEGPRGPSSYLLVQDAASL